MDIPKTETRFKSIQKFGLDVPSDSVYVMEPGDDMAPDDFSKFSEEMQDRGCTCNLNRLPGNKLRVICGCTSGG